MRSTPQRGLPSARARRCAPATAALLAAVALTSGCGGSGSTGTVDSSARDGRSPRVPPAATTRVLVELRRPALGALQDPRGLGSQARRSYVASLNGEVAALLGALRAKGVRLDGVVEYARVWHGFAATVRTGDLPKVQALGLRVEPVRRFYGALTGRGRPAPRAVAARAAPPRSRPGRRLRPAVALLDSGVAATAPGLRGRVVNGPDLSGGGRGDRHGTVVGSVLAAALPASERILSVRIARREGDPGVRSASESTTTDRLLAGLERAVDPNADGDTSDALPVALVGVSSPYAGFDDAPEATAVRSAANLGTLVVAPAGNEGPGAGSFGTIGSPAAARGALGVGALDGPGPAVPWVHVGIAGAGGRAIANGVLLGGHLHPVQRMAMTLAGRSQAAPRGHGAGTGASSLEYLSVDARPRASHRVVVVPVRAADGSSPPIADRAAAAAEAGAAALIVAGPAAGARFAPLPAGVAPAVPVIGVSGGAGRALLSAAGRTGAVAFLSGVHRRTESARTHPGAYSARGPTYTLAPKPDLVARGTALVADRSGGATFESGTSLAAARVAAAAVLLHRRRPDLLPAQLGTALVTTAHPAGGPLKSGAGRPAIGAATHLRIIPSTAALAFPAQRPGGVWNARLDLVVANRLRAPAVLTLTPSSDGRVQLSVFPDRFLMAGRSRARVIVTASAAAGVPALATGRIEVRGPGAPSAIPVAVPVEVPPRPRIGTLHLIRGAGGVTGVTFAAGSVRRRGAGIAVEPVGSLTLTLVDSHGATVRELTPVGGAPDVLPGEYSYRLPAETERAVHGRGYRFRVVARGTAGGTTSAESPPFGRP